MESDTVFTEIDVDGYEDPFHVYIEWKKDEFTITLLDVSNSTAYNGKMTSTELKKWSTSMKMKTTDEYLEKTKQFFLNGVDSDRENPILFSIDDGTFSWKKIIDKDLKLKYGSVNITKVNFTKTVASLVSFCTSQISQMEKANSVLTKEKDELNKEKMELLQKLEDFEKLGIKMEEELYAKFLAVLNAKKEKIVSLHEMLDKQEQIVQAAKQRTSEKEFLPSEDVDVDDPKPHSDYDSYSGDTDLDSDAEEKKAKMYTTVKRLKRRAENATSLDDELFDSEGDSCKSGDVIKRTRSKCSAPETKKVLSRPLQRKETVTKIADKRKSRTSIQTAATLLIEDI